MDRCERILVAMAKLDIDERLVKIIHAQASLVTGVILGAFDDIGLSQELKDAVRRRSADACSWSLPKSGGVSWSLPDRRTSLAVPGHCGSFCDGRAPTDQQYPLTTNRSSGASTWSPLRWRLMRAQSVTGVKVGVSH